MRRTSRVILRVPYDPDLILVEFDERGPVRIRTPFFWWFWITEWDREGFVSTPEFSRRVKPIIRRALKHLSGTEMLPFEFLRGWVM